MGVFRDVVSSLRGVVFLNRNGFLREHIVGAFKILLRLHHRRLLLKIRRLGRADGCLLLLEQGLVGIRLYPHEQVTFVDRFSIFDRQINDLARHFR